MDTPSSPDDLLGRVVGGRYRFEKPLRRGGMGQVYVAADLQGGPPVAVKVVRQALLEDPQALARFKREARLVTELQHDNIVRSIAAGEDGGLLWIAMELLEGQSLRERLDGRGRMSWQDTLPIVEQVVRALQVAHDKGVIHRDLKPENIMLVSSGAKLLDFGVAKQAHVEGGTGGTSNMTGTGFIVGTPGYVAPEVVLEGKTDDPRSDLYALGVTWFEMLTAQKPFTAKTAFALAMRHAHEPAPTPTSLVPYSPVPGPIEAVVLRLMAKNPDERPQSAQALLDLLANLAEESQRALAAGPLSLPPHANTVSATDLRSVGTDVVPFKTPVVLVGPTPATAMRAAGTPPPSGTPPPDVAQWMAQVPKKKIIAVVAAGLAVLAAFTMVIVLVSVRMIAPRQTPVPTPPTLILPPPTYAGPAPLPQTGSPLAIETVPAADDKGDPAAATANEKKAKWINTVADMSAEKKAEKKAEQKAAREARRVERKEKVPADPPSPPLEAERNGPEQGVPLAADIPEGMGAAIFKTTNVGTLAIVDGNAEYASGPKQRAIAPGQHTLVFRRKDGRELSVPFKVRAGKVTPLVMPFPP